MPVVFGQNEENLNDREYADVLGEVYEFPAQYKGFVEPGEQVVYYRGRRSAGGRSKPQVYLGVGLIGDVYPVGNRFQCLITDYQPFEPPLFFKDGDKYWEPRANEYKSAGKPVGYFFRNGIRPIDQESFDAICAAGFAAPPTPPPRASNADRNYADPAGILEVDEIAMELAMKEALARWPRHEVQQMPHNNPGFDIEIKKGGAPVHYIEVKGTRAHYPRFFISAGEVAHSERFAHCYSIWIYHSLDVLARTAELAEHTGAVTKAHFDLQTRQYFGRLLPQD
jgi:hypothetical protein